MAKVSVLVAAYNAERFLQRCLDSLCVQTFTDIEVLCVDDGSRDGTLAVMRRYKAKDARFRVLSLCENRGQAQARNEALRVAAGEYICFLDADDWYAPDAIEQAVNTFHSFPRCDCVLFQVENIDEESLSSYRYPMPPFEVLSGEEAFRLSLSWTIHGVYMARAALYRDHPYDATCRYYSDDNTTHVHYLLSREVRQCPGVYNYLQRAGSATHCVSVAHFDYLRANESMRRQMKALGVAASLIDEYENTRWLNLVDCYWFWYRHRQRFTESERRRIKEELARYWADIDHNKISRKHRRNFGFAPMPTFRLFCIEENIYFFLRELLRR